MRMLLISIWIQFGQSSDERNSEESGKVFLDWVAEMQTIKSNSLPRKVFSYYHKFPATCFGGASLEASCFVAYFRAEVIEGIEISFLGGNAELLLSSNCSFLD